MARVAAAQLKPAAGGAASAGQAFCDDFEAAAAAGWATTRGTWAVVDDGSKVYEQSLQENNYSSRSRTVAVSSIK